jgi:uncharacterized phiE125 gp8 family phage protein
VNLTVITPPPFEPVTLAQAYKQLRLTPDHAGSPGEETHPDDAMLRGSITTAREQVEQMARRSLIQQTLRLSMAGFPASCVHGIWYAATPVRIRLLRPPIIRVEAVSYYDGDNALQTVDADDYYVTDEQVPELRFVTGFAAPVTYDRPDALRVDYVCGYAPDGSPSTTQEEYAANVPSSLCDAILIGVQLLYDDMAPADREQMEKMREALIQPLRVQLAV